MKTIVTICAFVLLLSISAHSQTLTVHEWGTFTTLHGSEGGLLSGLYFEEVALPNFVYHFPGFAPDPSIATTGYMACNDVTVKMETPVLYFYSPVQRDVQVHVDFPMGAISQWYPNRSGGEPMPAGSTVNFDDPERNGMIEWKATILDPSSQAPLTQQSVPYKWSDPRQTGSNLVRNEQGEVEKYLFYRGVANFSLPVEALFNSNGRFSVTNTSKYDIPFIYVYDHVYSDSSTVWISGPLKSGETKVVAKPSKYYTEDNSIPQYNDFWPALMQAGLNRDEAQALLQTWNDGYFQTTGFKVFWIVPRALTDQILPLQITPKPDALERVLVGKTEILTPAFEKELVDYYTAKGNLDAWKSDRYHLAYMQRVQQLVPAAVLPKQSTGDIVIVPNPASSKIQLYGISDKASVTIRTVLGETVLDVQMMNSAEVDVHILPSGIYFVSITDGHKHQTLKLIKV